MKHQKLSGLSFGGRHEPHWKSVQGREGRKDWRNMRPGEGPGSGGLEECGSLARGSGAFGRVCLVLQRAVRAEEASEQAVEKRRIEN